MSWRQPTSAVAARSARRTSRPGQALRESGFDLGDMARLQLVEERGDLRGVEPGIGGLDAEEEGITRSQGEGGIVKYRVIRRWQAVERQHPEYRRERRAKDGALEG